MKQKEERRKELDDCFKQEKYSNRKYLIELEKFLDRVDNVKDENLKLEIIGQVHRIENIVSGIAVDMLERNLESENKK